MSSQSAQPEPGNLASPSQAAAVATGMLAAWFAAGSVGLVAPALLIALSWLALVAAAVAARPRLDWAGGLLLVALLASSALSPQTTLSQPFVVSAVLAFLAARTKPSVGRLLSISSLAVLSLALFRLAQYTVPTFWLLTDRVADAWGTVAGRIAGSPLTIGSSFAGLDFLVPMVIFVIGWLLVAARPRWSAVGLAIVAILVGHLAYLIGLAWLPAFVGALPPVPEPELGNPYVPPPFSWIWFLHQSLPWNFPLVAAGLQLGILVLLVRWSRWPTTPAEGHPWQRRLRFITSPNVTWACLVVLALAIPALALVHRHQGHLAGKRLLVNQTGRLDWKVPQHDEYGQASAGMFGMLPSLVESLGGQMQRTATFQPAELAAADVVLLLHPDPSLSANQQQRIWQYVAEGGSLLIVTDNFQPEYGLVGPPPALLEPLSIRVRQNSAISEAGHGEQNTSLAVCPMNAASRVRGSRLMTNAGPSLDIRWPARPMLAGRWSWSSAQYGMSGSGTQWLPGQKLGDLPLIAEQRFGRGKVIVLSDGSNFTNEGLAEGYSFVGSTLSYLAQRRGGAAAWWRQLGIVLGCLLLVALLLLATRPPYLLGAACLALLALIISQKAAAQASRVVPDGALIRSSSGEVGNRVAYIDASHVEPFNQLDWVFHAVDGLQLTLMRNGYLPLFAPEITRERLERCGLLISIAPARPFTRRERNVIDEFVRAGGILICTVGAEHSPASTKLLGQFGFRVPYSPVPTTDDQVEPEPMGHIRSLFLNARDYGVGDYRCGVTFDAAWPVEATRRGAEILVRGRQERSVVVSRDVGRGTVVLIGDSRFALNKNLEYIGGQRFTYGYENAHFWRWLISRITGQAEFVPPPPEEPAADATEQSGNGAEEEG